MILVFQHVRNHRATIKAPMITMWSPPSYSGEGWPKAGEGAGRAHSVRLQPMTHNETIKSTMTAIFKRKGQGGLYTRLFDDLDLCQQNLLLKHLHLTNEELPVLGSAESDDTWMILTTTRVVWSSNGNIQSLNTDEAPPSPD